MIHEINAEKVNKDQEKFKENLQESAKPLDPVRGEQLERTSRGRQSRGTSSEVDDSSSRENSLSSKDRNIFSREATPDSTPLSSRETSPSPKDRLDRLVSSKIDKGIIPEKLFSSQDKKPEKKGFAKSAWEILQKPLKSQATLMAVMFVDGAIDEISQKFSTLEGELLHAGGGSGGKDSGGMPPYFPNSSDSGKEEKGDKTKKGKKGEFRASKSKMKPEAHGALKETEGVLKGTEGEVAKELVRGARVRFFEDKQKERLSREAEHLPSSLHNEPLVADGLEDKTIEV